MSAKIWEVAKALRKGMVQVIRDFQKMGVSVKSLTDVVTDNEMLELAEQYGRRDCVFPLISNEYIFELAKTWDEENILKLMPEFNKEEGFIEEDVVKRLAIISNCINEKSNRILCSEPTVRKPKAFQAIYLLGKGDRALQTVDAAYDFQVFLIPKSKEKIHDCIINSGGKAFGKIRVKSACDFKTTVESTGIMENVCLCAAREKWICISGCGTLEKEIFWRKVCQLQDSFR